MTAKKMLHKKTWEQFQISGLLWWINRMLHLFGWAIVYEYDKDNQLSEVYPARCKFRGFSEDVETRGFVNLTKHIHKNCEKLLKDLDE